MRDSMGPAALLVAAVALCYHHAPRCGFVFDDISAVRDNRDLRPETPLASVFSNDFWGTPMSAERSHKSYRPLCVLTFRWNYAWGELEPCGYHVVNVVLHAAVTVAFYRLCRTLLDGVSNPRLGASAGDRSHNGSGRNRSDHANNSSVANTLNNSSDLGEISEKLNHFGTVRTQDSNSHRNISDRSCHHSSVGSGGMSNGTTAFVAALLFAVHPVHTEAVTGVVGRAELLSSLFFVWALQAYTRSTRDEYSLWSHRTAGGSTWVYLGLAILCVGAAMLCKEQGITVVGVCCVYEIAVARRLTAADCLRLLTRRLCLPSRVVARSLTRAAALVGVSVLLMVARLRVMGGQLPVFTRFDNPAAVADAPWRQLTLNYMLPLNAWLLLAPAWLCCDWTMGTVPLIDSSTDPRLFAVAAFYAGFASLVVHAVRGRGGNQRALLLALALTALPFLPASNLLFPVGFVVAERVLYAPSMGFCLLVAVGFRQLIGRSRTNRVVGWTLMVGLVLAQSARTVVRNYDWTDEYSIFTAGLRVNRANAKLFNNVGHALENSGHHAEALTYFTRAVKVQPDDIGAHINVGRALKALERYAEAEGAYRAALALLPPVRPGQSYTTRIAPNYLNVFLNLANLLARDPGGLVEADSLLRTAISMRADFTQAYINRGDVLMKLSRTPEAQRQYETALHYDPHNPDIHYNLGVVQLEQGRPLEAAACFERALALDPRHRPTLFNSAVLIQERGDTVRRPEAVRRLKALLGEEPDNEKIYFNLAMLATDERDYVSARAWFDQSIRAKPDFRSALFNAALMVANDEGRPLEAVPYLQQLLLHHPRHTKGLILMGDIYINQLKDLDAAERCFLTILDTEPNNSQAAHNLCVVYVERGALTRAERCLEGVVAMAPGEEYVKAHLGIVRQRRAQLERMGGRRGEEGGAVQQGAQQLQGQQPIHEGQQQVQQKSQQPAQQPAQQQQQVQQPVLQHAHQEQQQESKISGEIKHDPQLSQHKQQRTVQQESQQEQEKQEQQQRSRNKKRNKQKTT